MNIDVQNPREYRSERKTVMASMRELLHGYHLPKGWLVHYGDSSITITSPSKRRSVKMDIYKVVDINIMSGKGDTIAAKSLRHKCESLADTWKVFESTLKEFIEGTK